MRRIACTLGVGRSAACVSKVAEHAHFAGDVGAAYVVPGVAEVRFATRQTGRSAPRAGATIRPRCGRTTWDLRARREQADQLPVDVPAKFMPLLLALGIPVALAPPRDVNEGEQR